MLKKGFTLIELLMVIAIIGVISSVLMVNLNSSKTKAKDTVRLQNLKEIQNNLALYAYDFDIYPGVSDQWYKIELDSECAPFSGNPRFRDIIGSPYITNFPKDFGANCGWYMPINGKNGYVLLFDPDDNNILNATTMCAEGGGTYYCIKFE